MPPMLQPDPPELLVEALTAAGRTVATCESMTGGMVAVALTSVPGASAVVRGGLVVYATDLKHSLAGVDAALLDERGAVDPDVALAMAHGARTVCGADYGIGVTGVAGPDPQDGKPVGTVYVAITGPEWERVGTMHAGNAPRKHIRRSAVQHALRLLTAALRDLSRPGEPGSGEHRHHTTR